MWVPVHAINIVHMLDPRHLSAREAAAELNVSLPTLYAYVSRGLIRSEGRPGSRQRLYSAADVRDLVAGRIREDAGDAEARSALRAGPPVLDSAVTLITGDAIHYRGRDLARLVEDATVESVAALLWDCGPADPFAGPVPPTPAGFDTVRAAVAGMGPLERAQVLLPLVMDGDPAVYNLTPAGIARTGAKLLRWLAAIVAGRDAASADPVHRVLAAAWGADTAGAELIRAALVACMDHELNASTFAVRVVASTGASPVGAVVAGLAALRGPRHGGMTERVATALPDLLAAEDVEGLVAARLRRGDDLPGFGHPLYPDGDPRARLLLDRLDRAFPRDPLLARARRLAAAAREVAGSPPTVDFALALLSRRLGLPEEAPMAIFAAGRAAGWVAHAAEQAQTGQLIRPRARYVGIRP